MLCVYPEQERAFFVSMNADSEDANYGRLDSLIVASLGLSGVSAATGETAVDLGQWNGTYVVSPARFAMFSYVDVVLGFAQVTADDGGITIKPFQSPAARLEPVGGALFRAKGRTISSHVLLTTSDGRPVISDGVRTLERVSLWRMVPLWGSIVAGILGLLYVIVRGTAAAIRARLGPRQPLFAPFVATVALLLAVGLLARQSLLDLGSRTLINVALALLTAALPIALAIGTWRAVRAARTGGTRMVAMDAVAQIALLQWLVVLAWWGLVPLRLWR